MFASTREAVPPQYSVLTVTRVDGKPLGDPAGQLLDDPFVTHTTTVTLDPEDLRTALDRGEPLVVVVITSVSGSRAALAHVFRPIDLSPNDEQPHQIEGAGMAADEFPGEGV